MSALVNALCILLLAFAVGVTAVLFMLLAVMLVNEWRHR